MAQRLECPFQPTHDGRLGAFDVDLDRSRRPDVFAHGKVVEPDGLNLDRGAVLLAHQEGVAAIPEALHDAE